MKINDEFYARYLQSYDSKTLKYSLNNNYEVQIISKTIDSMKANIIFGYVRKIDVKLTGNDFICKCFCGMKNCIHTAILIRYLKNNGLYFRLPNRYTSYNFYV